MAAEERGMITSDKIARIGRMAAGFDAVEIHSAHDSIFSQFLSPLVSRRDDEWGGSVANRTRVHRETISAISKAAGTDYPVILKPGVQDVPPRSPHP